jgi:hypothetical protein
MALQSYALRAAAEGAVLAYAEVTGETWKAYEAPAPASAAAAPRSKWPHSRPPDRSRRRGRRAPPVFVFFPIITYSVFVWRRGRTDRSARFPQLGSAPVNEKRVGLTRSHLSPWPERSARRSQRTRATRQRRYNECGYGMDLEYWALYFWRHLKYRADPAPLQVGCDFWLSGSVRQRRDPSVADDLRSNFYAWLSGIVGCSWCPIQSGRHDFDPEVLLLNAHDSRCAG